MNDIKTLVFPQNAYIKSATCKLPDMGERTVSLTVGIDGFSPLYFPYDWEIEFRGERYIMPLRKPHVVNDTSSIDLSSELIFQHWAEYQLKRWMFFTLQPVESGTAVPDKYIASVSLHLGDMCDLFGRVLKYYYGDAFTVDLNPNWKYSYEPTTIEINYSYMWDVLLEFFKIYRVRWSIEKLGEGERYAIKVGYEAPELSHIFKYGFDGGLLKLERQVQNENIRNMLLGRGGEKNLPYRYFKDVDPDNPDFAPDPDWIPELRNIYFSELRPKSFRDYIRGWKTNPYRQLTEADGTPITPYPHDSSVSPIAVEPFDTEYAKDSFAYILGHSDYKFNPVEYVRDNDSIRRYGPIIGGLENNEEIYPSIQGVSIDPIGRVDEAIGVIQPVFEDGGSDNPQNVETKTIEVRKSNEQSTQPNTIATIRINPQVKFKIPEGKMGNLKEGPISVGALYCNPDGVYSTANHLATLRESVTIRVYNSKGEEISASGIPAGEYTFSVIGKVLNMSDNLVLQMSLYVTSMILTISDAPMNVGQDGFYIYVKNIWQTQKEPGESDIEYAERVWTPILGDRDKNEAKVVFSTGMLSVSEDYEFPIIATPTYEEKECIWKEYRDGEWIERKSTSHWKIHLGLSDADYESLGVCLPSRERFASAGDFFLFIGIDMPHLYVLWGESELEDYKTDELQKVCDINPTYLVTPDRVRIGNEGLPGAIIDSLIPGAMIQLSDPYLITGKDGEPKASEYLYIQSLTFSYTYSDNTAPLVPDVEMILGTEYELSSNPVELIQGEVDSIRRQIGAISNVSQIVRKVGDSRYIRKDISDRTPYSIGIGGMLEVARDIHTNGKTTSDSGVQFGQSYAPGLSGVGGFIDGKGNGELESLSLRRWLEVPELRYNRATIMQSVQWATPGGGIVKSVTASGDSGVVTLKLEDGELPNVAVDDICMGIFHSYDSSANATSDSDDGKGNFAFAGFATVYFRITSVTNDSFSYTLRPGYHIHPSEAMHFACYGNFTDNTRQGSRYETSSYIRLLQGVNDWEFTEAMIASQYGDLSNLNIQGYQMNGFGLYADTIYYRQNLRHVDIRFAQMEIEAVEDDGTPTTMPTLLRYNDEVLVKGCIRLGGEILKEGVMKWSVERSGGDEDSDNEWNGRHKDLTPDADGNIYVWLRYSDLGKVFRTLFTFRTIVERKSGNMTITQSLARSISFEDEGVTIVDDGNWEVGKSYLHEGIDVDGRRVTNDVWHNGQKWRCTQDNVAEASNAPGFGNPLWQWIEGDPELHVEFKEKVQLVSRTDPKIPLTIVARYHGEDVTAHIADSNVVWSRESKDKNGVPRTILDQRWGNGASGLPLADRGKAVVFTAADIESVNDDITFIAEVTLVDPVMGRAMRSRTRTKQ